MNSKQTELQNNSDQLKEVKRILSSYDSDEEGFVSFNRVVEGEFNILGQYAAAFVDGFGGKPKFAEDLVKGDPSDWYSLRIKPEDVIVFGERFKAYKKEQITKALGQFSSQ
jgi:hypothetical protein